MTETPAAYRIYHARPLRSGDEPAQEIENLLAARQQAADDLRFLDMLIEQHQAKGGAAPGTGSEEALMHPSVKKSMDPTGRSDPAAEGRAPEGDRTRGIVEVTGLANNPRGGESDVTRGRAPSNSGYAFSDEREKANGSARQECPRSVQREKVMIRPRGQR